MARSGRRVRILRIIARMNVGGPAHHVTLLAGRLPADRFETRLLSGSVAPGEASFDAAAARKGVAVTRVAHLTPQLRPLEDLRALVDIARQIRAYRPDIVHTHTAKAGALGRLGALLAGPPRPVLVHTYHGHVLTEYFGRIQSYVYRITERALGTKTDCLIGVSQATADDLIALGVASADRFRVIPLGLELEHLLEVPEAPERTPEGDALRAQLEVTDDEVLAVFVGRLVPIKRVDVLLEAVSILRDSGTPIRLAIIGTGELREQLEGLAQARGIAPATAFLGCRLDLAAIASASDVAVLSSANEGTPVALIEAAAAARPAVATAVGGVSDIVTADTGRLVGSGDARAFATALRDLVADSALRRELGAAAREHVRARWSSERLIADVEDLYEELLRRSSSTGRRT